MWFDVLHFLPNAVYQMIGWIGAGWHVLEMEDKTLTDPNWRASTYYTSGGTKCESVEGKGGRGYYTLQKALPSFPISFDFQSQTIVKCNNPWFSVTFSGNIIIRRREISILMQIFVWSSTKACFLSLETHKKQRGILDTPPTPSRYMRCYYYCIHSTEHQSVVFYWK
jgi:hypothetical protein